MVYILAIIAMFFICMPVMAQEKTDSTAPAAQQGTRIVTDEETGTIRFLVEGRDIVRIDATGLHVRESFAYGGTLTDYGRSGFDANAAQSGEGENAP